MISPPAAEYTIIHPCPPLLPPKAECTWLYSYRSHSAAYSEAVICLRWRLLRGSIQPIRDCCSVNSPLTSSGWAWLLFKWVSFVSAPKLIPPRDRFPRGRFNGITVRSAPRGVVTPELSEAERGVRAFRSRREGGRENKTMLQKRCPVVSGWYVTQVIWSLSRASSK